MGLSASQSMINMNGVALRGKLGFDKVGAIIDVENMVET